MMFQKRITTISHEDIKFERMMEGFNRLMYLFRVQNESLSEQLEKLIQLINRKVTRMFKGQKHLKSLREFRTRDIEKEK